MSDEVLLDGVIFQKTVDNKSYSRCFQCGKFFTPDIIDMQLQLFCSKKCEKKSDEYWENVVNDFGRDKS